TCDGLVVKNIDLLVILLQSQSVYHRHVMFGSWYGQIELYTLITVVDQRLVVAVHNMFFHGFVCLFRPIKSIANGVEMLPGYFSQVMHVVSATDNQHTFSA